MKNYLRALSFLTVIPLPFVLFSGNGKELSHAASSFPLAGATLGLVLAGAAWLLLHPLPLAAVAIIALVLSFLLTRGLHFDGLADTADGLIGTTDREKMFKAMEDSAIGVMGAAVLFFVCLLKLVLLVELGTVYLPIALFIMPLAGRWAIVYAGAWFKPARNRGLGDLFLSELRFPILIKASLGALFPLALVVWWRPMLLLPLAAGCLSALVVAHLLSLYAAGRLGGLSGDILGACSELGEMFFLLGFYIFLRADGFATSSLKAVTAFVQIL